ncbi:3141_t:CDS:2 [Diversispora eburnea]|uniref:3141_t:CDS:1 n=1 Tax=Diversispora eburnea TaxID=1213867 RepID=A0A9N9A6F4_9GLOM|nr:3141_t:CDS:2 [Diversispora eburnea]
MSTTKIIHWSISKYFLGTRQIHPYALIILNQPISLWDKHFHTIWENGDLDSLRDDVRKFYISRGTEVQQDPDQNTTDFMKCIDLVRKKEQESSEPSLKYEIIALGAFGGPNCGIIPIGIERAIVTTTGLEWNLANSPTSFGEMISTSNHLIDDVITIETDSPVLWTSVAFHQRVSI